MPTCPEKFNSIKSETGGHEINASERNDEEGKIIVKSNEIQKMPACSEQLNSTEFQTVGPEINSFKGYDEELTQKKILVESKNIQVPTFPEQFNTSKSEN